MMIARGFLGIAAILALAWCVSENRRAVPLRTVFGGVILQLALAALLLRFPPAARVFLLLDDAVNALQKATDAGTSFVFGYLGGGPAPFRDRRSRRRASFWPSARCRWCWSSARWRRCCSTGASCSAWCRASRGCCGARWASAAPLGLGAAVHIFVGMVEAPLLVRPYLARMSRGELFALMTCGMAGIAGTMMVIYATILGPVIPNALGFILIASVISTPAALAVAAIMIPFDAAASEPAQLVTDDPASGAMDAIVRGTAAGLQLLINVIAMLIVLVALTTA